MMESEKFQFDVNFQIKILKLMIEDCAVLAKARKYLKPNFFENKWLGWCYTQIIDYYEKYQKIITIAVFLEQIKAITTPNENLMEYLAVTKQIFAEVIKEPEYIKDKLEEFIKRNIFVAKMKESAELYNKNKFDESMTACEECWNEVNKVNFHDSHRINFFNDLDQRITKRNEILDKADYRFPTGILELDKIINGGLSRGELGVVCADSGVGKSIFMLSFAASVIRTWKGKVLLFNLEGKDLQVENRFESRFLNVNYKTLMQNTVGSEKFEEYKSYLDTFVISNLHASYDRTVLDLESEIEELKSNGFIPDVIIIDYADLLDPRGISKDNKYLAMEQIYKDLKTLANKHNCAVWTASQVHRVGKEVNEEDSSFVYTRKNIADSYCKVRYSDLLITLNRTKSEKDANRMRVYVDKYRDDECKQLITIQTNYENMQPYVPGAASYDRYFNR